MKIYFKVEAVNLETEITESLNYQMDINAFSSENERAVYSFLTEEIELFQIPEEELSFEAGFYPDRFCLLRIVETEANPDAYSFEFFPVDIMQIVKKSIMNKSNKNKSKGENKMMKNNNFGKKSRESLECLCLMENLLIN